MHQVDARPLGPGLPWDYEALARAHARSAHALLDIGTGGAERLARIVAGLPVQVVATEGWAVNVPLAARRLAPLGGQVVRCSSCQLPFRDARFDLVLSRHTALGPDEVLRVLRSGGSIVTQQVDQSHWHELSHFFTMQDFGDHFTRYREAFRAAGLQVTTARHEQPVAYANLADVVFLLLVAPWQVPGFNPRRDLDALLAFEDAQRTPDGIILTESRYLIVAEDRP